MIQTWPYSTTTCLKSNLEVCLIPISGVFGIPACFIKFFINHELHLHVPSASITAEVVHSSLVAAFFPTYSCRSLWQSGGFILRFSLLGCASCEGCTWLSSRYEKPGILGDTHGFLWKNRYTKRFEHFLEGRWIPGPNVLLLPPPTLPLFLLFPPLCLLSPPLSLCPPPPSLLSLCPLPPPSPLCPALPPPSCTQHGKWKDCDT